MVQTCPNCGSPNREGYRFCSTCGAHLTPPTSDASRPTQGESAAPAEFAVQSWDDKPSSEGSVPTVTPHASQSPYPAAPRVPSALPPYNPSSVAPPARDVPPVELDRKGEATYAPYTASAVRHVEKSGSNRAWLVPAIIVAGLLLVVLVGTAIFLFFSPRSTTIQNPATGDSNVSIGPTATQLPAASVPTPVIEPTRAQAQPAPCVLPPNATPEDEVKHVICVSNGEQIRAWKELNPEILKGTRTGDYLQENLEQVEMLKKQDVYAEPVNLHIDFLEVKVEGDRATVKTYEKWAVTFYKVSNNAVVQKRGPDRYNETYHMVKQDGRWLIEKVDFIHLTPQPGN